MSDDARVEELVEKHLEQLATDAELGELDQLLRQRPEAAAALLEAARLDTLLAIHLQARPAPGAHPVRRSPRARRLAAIGVAASLLCLLASWGWWKHASGAGHRVLAGAVAIEGVPVTRVGDNRPLEVVGPEEAVIELAGGARAQLLPASRATIRSGAGQPRQVLELVEGGGRFRVPPAARGLRVDTSSGSITALGTDFEVSLWSTQGKGDQEMSFRSLFVLAVAVASGIVQVDVPGERHTLGAGTSRVFGAEVAGPKVKDLGAWLPSGDVLGFTVKGQPFALERLLPGVQGALGLSGEQKAKIAAALQETLNSDAVRAAMAKVKLSPNATAEEKQKAKQLIDEARAKLKRLVSEILSTEQKSLAERISGLGEEVRKEIRESMEADFTAAKGDKEKMKPLQEQFEQRVQAAFRTRIPPILTAEQRAGFEKAAAAAAQAPKKKPKK